MPPSPPAHTQVLHVPATRTFRCWTHELIQLAELQADRGDLRLAADLCEALLGDDRLQGVLRTRSQALFGLQPTFEATSGDGRRHARVGKALEQGEDWWRLCPVDESKLFFAWGILLGVALGRLEWWEERPWKPVPGIPGTFLQDKPRARMHRGRLTPTIKLWHPRCLRFHAEAGIWIARLDDGTEEWVTPGKNGWLLFTPYGLTRPWSTAPWRGAAAWWLMKHRAMEYWERHGEKGAHIFLESSEHANPDERGKIGEQMADAGQDAVTVAPHGYRANLLESRATGDLYDKQIASADTAVAVLLLGHANNAEVKGANTGATAGENIRFQITADDAEGWAAFTHDQVLAPYAEANYGDPELAQWPLYPVPKPDEAAKRGAGLKALGDGVKALKTADAAVDTRRILEANHIPLLTPEQMAKEAEEARARAPQLAPTAPSKNDPDSDGDDDTDPASDSDAAEDTTDDEAP